MCGLFGIINPSPKRIDWPMVDVLGIANDSRGGDSCGLFIDGEVNYGIDKTAKWVDWYHCEPLHKKYQKARILLGHCRKASVGGKDLDKAHPVCHRDEQGNIDFVMVHNGTIKNYEDLAKKYIPDEDIKDKSDTQVMASIFYNAGYDVLGEYTGGAVFVTVDYRSGEPVTRVFQGVSKERYNDAKPSEERPFYFGKFGESFVFSSIANYLEPFVPGNRFKEVSLWCLPPNTLCKVTPKGLINLAEYDRSDKVQTTYGYASSSSYGGGNPTILGVKKTTTCSTNCGGNTTSTGMSSEKSVMQSNIGININSVIPSQPDFITYNAAGDIYYDDKVAAHGLYHLNIIGRKYDKVGKNTEDYYFWNGVILFGKPCFDLLLEIAAKKHYSPQVLGINDPNLIHYLSPYPWRNSKERDYHMVESSTFWNYHPFEGKANRIFDMFSRSYAGGLVVGTEHFTGYLESFEEFNELVKSTKVFENLDSLRNAYLNPVKMILPPSKGDPFPPTKKTGTLPVVPKEEIFGEDTYSNAD